MKDLLGIWQDNRRPPQTCFYEVSEIPEKGTLHVVAKKLNGVSKVNGKHIIAENGYIHWTTRGESSHWVEWAANGQIKWTPSEGHRTEWTWYRSSHEEFQRLSAEYGDQVSEPPRYKSSSSSGYHWASHRAEDSSVAADSCASEGFPSDADAWNSSSEQWGVRTKRWAKTNGGAQDEALTEEQEPEWQAYSWGGDWQEGAWGGKWEESGWNNDAAAGAAEQEPQQDEEEPEGSEEQPEETTVSGPPPTLTKAPPALAAPKPPVPPPPAPPQLPPVPSSPVPPAPGLSLEPPAELPPATSPGLPVGPPPPPPPPRPQVEGVPFLHLPPPPPPPRVASAPAAPEPAAPPDHAGLPPPPPQGAAVLSPNEQAIADLRKECISSFLLPLCRRWQSVRLGYIWVRRRVDPKPDDLEALLEEVPLEGAEATELGRVVLVGPSKAATVELVVESSPGVVKRCRISPESSSGVVMWVDRATGKVTDWWHSRLLDTLAKAVPFAIAKGLDANWSVCLRQINRLTPKTTAPLSVAFCVSTMNRLWQLRRALPINLAMNWPHRDWVHFYVVDFGSSDETLDFLLNRCRAAIDAGLLSVYSAPVGDWHAPKAKNTAHAMATEDIVVNLDGDNLTGPLFALDVVKQFYEGYTALHYNCGEGTCGRIACYREDFMLIGGYDEDSYPMGAQDVDLYARLGMLPGAKPKLIKNPAFSQAIPNQITDKVANCTSRWGNFRWGQMDVTNRGIYDWRRAGGQVVRNIHQDYIGAPAQLLGGGPSLKAHPWPGPPNKEGERRVTSCP